MKKRKDDNIISERILTCVKSGFLMVQNSIYFLHINQMLSERTNLRSTLVDIYQSYCSNESSGSDLSQISQSKMMFFADFLKRNKMISCRIQNISTVPKQSFHRAYTLYQIEILTQQLFFTTQKRYSEFQKLNQKIKKFKGQDINFPKKTYFQSGTQISVTSYRIKKLNDFITYILGLQQDHCDIKYAFLDFIGLWDKYIEKGVDINNTSYQYFLANNENVYIQILKLNQNPKSICSILERIKKLIFDYKIKVSLQTARQLYLGLENDKIGLLASAFQMENQYVSIQCLQLIVDLLDVELSKNSELFLRSLQNCPARSLVVKQRSLLQNLTFKKLYFELLKKYQSKPIQRDLKSIFGQNRDIYKEYMFWLKQGKAGFHNKLVIAETHPRQIYDKIECKRSFEKVKDRIQNDQKGEYIGQNEEGLMYQGQSYIGFKIKFEKNNQKAIQQLDRAKWQTFQEQIRSNYSDVVTKTLNFKQQRRFKFNENYQQEKDQITLEPIHTNHFDDCFFEFSEVIQKQEEYEVIQIIYFCHNNSQQIKQFMKQKLLSYWQEKLMK